MKRLMKRLSHAAFAIVAAAVLTFGAQTAYASAAANPCLNPPPGWIGTCPPLDGYSCEAQCYELYGAGNNFCVGGCCICQI